jgi:fatty acid desaturase
VALFGKVAGGRDYSLLGPEAQAALDKGLAGAEWYSSEISRSRMKELTRRADLPAIRDTTIWLGAMAVFGTIGGILWGSWLAVPFFVAYGILYGSASDSRWHECGHGTPFKTRWMNEVVYQIASFMVMNDPTVWRWSHFRHHTDTLIVGRDPEIQAMRPPRLIKILLNLFGLVDVPIAFFHMFLHASGRLTAEERTFVPETERFKVVRTSRLWLAGYGATLAACLVTGSILPAMYIGLPRMYGCALRSIFGLTQHAGLGEDVLDHRLNSRTVYFNPVFRFIYWNMNYHLEHHMFPMVPYHRLPELHREMKHDIPVPFNGLWDAYRQILPAILRQLRDPTYFVWQELPPGARPHPQRAIPDSTG